jgi:heptosyltransferase-3
MERILVLRGGALGDFIVTLPLLATLRGNWPAARIELAGNATAAELARNRGLLDAVHSQHEARWATLFGTSDLAADFRGWLAAFDVVINFWPDPGGELRARFPLLAGQRFFSAPAAPAIVPAAAHYLSVVRELGMSEGQPFFRLLPLALQYGPSTEGIGPLPKSPLPIVIHPGSGSPRKNWPPAEWRRLVEILRSPVMVILGDAECELRVDAIFSGVSGVELLVRRPLEELVTRLNRCRLFVGHDSGISHLAAACGAKCVLLFGPTEPACWAPPVPSARVLRPGTDLSSLAFDAVDSAVRAALADQT